MLRCLQTGKKHYQQLTTTPHSYTLQSSDTLSNRKGIWLGKNLATAISKQISYGDHT